MNNDNNDEIIDYDFLERDIISLCKEINCADLNCIETNEDVQLLTYYIDTIFKSANMNTKIGITRLMSKIGRICSKQLLNTYISDYINKKNYEQTILLSTKIQTILKTQDETKPYILILIESHGLDTQESLEPNNNVLMYNLSSVPGIYSNIFDDNEPLYLLEKIQNMVQSSTEPISFKEVTDNLSGISVNSNAYDIRTRYIRNINNSFIYPSEKIKQMQKYSKYSCRLTKPIKDKVYTFAKIYRPGIHVVYGNFLSSELMDYRGELINLITPDGLRKFNELFDKESFFSENIFKSGREASTIPPIMIDNRLSVKLSDIIKYFDEFGISNIGIIDLSCRNFSNQELLSDNNIIHKQMVVEEIPTRCPSNLFGGASQKGFKQRKQNNIKKKTNNNKKYKYKKQNKTIKINK